MLQNIRAITSKKFKVLVSEKKSGLIAAKRRRIQLAVALIKTVLIHCLIFFLSFCQDPHRRCRI